MAVDLRWEKRFILGDYEPVFTEAMISTTKAGDTVYDVGAHVGYFSLLFGKLVGPRGIVIAIEPSPAVLDRLEHNIRRNIRRIHARVDVKPLAASNQLGHARFFLGGSTSTGRLARLPADAPGESIVEVPTVTLDSLVTGGLPPPNVIKIDVEYYEARVIEGSLCTIKKYRPVVLCEIHDIENARAVYSSLTNLGYSILHLGSGSTWDDIDQATKGHILAEIRP